MRNFHVTLMLIEGKYRKKEKVAFRRNLSKALYRKDSFREAEYSPLKTYKRELLRRSVLIVSYIVG